MPTKNLGFTQMLRFFRADNWFLMLATKIVGYSRGLVLIRSKFSST